MKQEEILQYNKRCALFLGAIYSEQAEAWGFGNAKNIGSKMFHGVMYHNVIQAERFEKELKFHSDWNWIMEVKEKICQLDIIDELDTLYDSVAKGYHCVLLPTYKNTFDGFYTKVLSTEKEAVVEAINQFLIWYEQNK